MRTTKSRTSTLPSSGPDNSQIDTTDIHMFRRTSANYHPLRIGRATRPIPPDPSGRRQQTTFAVIPQHPASPLDHPAETGDPFTPNREKAPTMVKRRKEEEI